MPAAALTLEYNGSTKTFAMKKSPFTLEITRQAARFTFYKPVSGADYCQPTQSFAIPRDSFRELCRMPPSPGEISFFNFSAAQLKAHGAVATEP